MFRWYQEAEVCYAILEDVQDLEGFSGARWFTRGWTLQELIAPKHLIFYNSKWQDIGTRDKLARTIQEITKIDEHALQGAGSLSYVRGMSLAKRMAWAANRETKRDEDIAYCLMGLLDVNMPLLYGEGGIKAFRRLQEEYLKVNPDQSFLAWLHHLDAERRRHADVNILAAHPKDFEKCGEISLTGDDISPFSLNNKELQIRLPMFRDMSANARRSPEHFAILACCPGDRTEERIVIPLYAVEKSAKTFTLFPSSNSRFKRCTTMPNAFKYARLRDCCILRTSNYPTRRMLSVSDLPESLVSWKPKIVYLNMSTSKWTCLQKPATSRIPTVRVPGGPKQASYGILFQTPSTYSDIQNSEDKTKRLKVLVRVDVGFEERYSVNVSIRLFHVPVNDFLQDYSASASTPFYRKSARSCSQAIFTPTGRWETLSASVSWERESNMDLLFLDFDLVAGNKPRTLGLDARVTNVLQSLITEDPWVHSVYTMLLWFVMPANMLDQTSLHVLVIWTLTVLVLYYDLLVYLLGIIKRLQKHVELRVMGACQPFLLLLVLVLLRRKQSQSKQEGTIAWFEAVLLSVYASPLVEGMVNFGLYIGFPSEDTVQRLAEKPDPNVGLESLLLEDEQREKLL
jgi:hypothetical protein